MKMFSCPVANFASIFRNPGPDLTGQAGRRCERPARRTRPAPLEFPACTGETEGRTIRKKRPSWFQDVLSFIYMWGRMTRFPCLPSLGPISHGFGALWSYHRFSFPIQQRCKPRPVSVPVKQIMDPCFRIHPDFHDGNYALTVNLLKPFHKTPPFHGG